MENNDISENKKSTRPANLAALIGSSALALSFTGCGVTAEDLNELGRQMEDFREVNSQPQKKTVTRKPTQTNSNNNWSRPTTGQPTRTTRTYSDRDALSKFTALRYRYIDAKVLANYWGERNPYDAKLRLGRKMLQFGPSNGPVHMNAARTSVLRKPVNQWPVFFNDGGYSFSDMEKLGRYWGRGTWEAKVKVSRFLINNQDHFNKQALAAARNY